MSNLIKAIAAAVMFFAGTAIASAWPAIVTSDLNMRTGPGTNHPVIVVLPGGATVDVRSCQGGWCQLAYGNRVGFASERYLARQEARPPAPPPPPAVEPRPPYWAGPRPPFWGGPRPPGRTACDERQADWAIGRFAGQRTVELARSDANARLVRVLRPGDFYTQELRPDRLSIEVNQRNRIVDLRCE